MKAKLAVVLKLVRKNISGILKHVPCESNIAKHSWSVDHSSVIDKGSFKLAHLCYQAR